MGNIHLQKFVFTIAFCILFCANSFSQNKKQYNIFSTGDNSSLLTNAELKNAVSEAVILNINKEELLSLNENRSPEITLDIPYTDNTSAKLNLKRFDILKPGAKIVARTARGNEEVKMTDVAVSYTGKVEGLDNSLVTITFTKDDVTGLMVTQTDNYVLGAINDKSGKKTDTYILYKESDMKVKNTFHCDADDNLSPELIAKMQKTIKGQMDASSTDLYVAEIALELDFITYNVYGASVTNTANYALTLLAASSAIYNKEENVRFIIPYIRVWTVQDPYNGTTSSALLNQFRSEWTANQQSVQRTLAHFITRRGGGLGGIAWLDQLCASPAGGFGYGFSGTDGPILPLPTYSWDVMVVTHEIGHNFGSPHTFNCNWPGGPIDSCYQVEGGCYSGPPIAIVGTIMSYCHLNGSISLVKGFGPLPQALIRSNAEFANCMYISDRPLFLGYPNGGETYQTGSSKQIYWGSSLTGNINIELSKDNGSTWQTIQNNVPAQQKQYIWTIPTMPSVLQAKIRVIDSSNPAVGDTTDASFKIALNMSGFTVINSNTPRLVVSSTSTETQPFAWLRAGTEPSLRYKFSIKKLSTTIDYVYNSNNNGTDSMANVRKSWLDSVAQTMGTIGDSVRCTWRAYCYNGIDSLGSTNSILITLVRNTVGINVLTTIIPDKFSLGNNYPNPFNPTTNIKFEIAKSTFAELKIFDSRGREINTLVNEKLQPGSYEYNFNAVNLPSGAYFYRLKTDEFTETKRMILVK